MQTGVWMCLLGTSLLAAPAAEGRLQRYEYLQRQMGVPFRITLYAPDEATANKAARAAYSRIEELNGILSDYDPQSELMRLCKTSGPGKPVQVSRELMFVLSRSQALSQRSGGAFDVTVGPVVRLWRRARRRKQLPNADRLSAARTLVGFEHVHLCKQAGTVELGKSGMRLDLGGIAKGYAGDEALDILRMHGVTRALIDGGGDVVLGDAPPGKPGWRIGVAPFSKPDAPPSRFLTLKNVAVATSGDAYQHVEIGGKRYSHIIDPQTGLGLTRPASVTVIAPNGITADGLASAVSVLGPQRGLKLIDASPKTAALYVHVQNRKLRTSESKSWKTFASHTDEKDSDCHTRNQRQEGGRGAN